MSVTGCESKWEATLGNTSFPKVFDANTND